MKSQILSISIEVSTKTPPISHQAKTSKELKRSNLQTQIILPHNIMHRSAETRRRKIDTVHISHKTSYTPPPNKFKPTSPLPPSPFPLANPPNSKHHPASTPHQPPFTLLVGPDPSAQLPTLIVLSFLHSFPFPPPPPLFPQLSPPL